ncbi:Ribosome biogenesis protein RLP24 [Colletotrichum truncatum]|uniref:Ribosome biogenesis protein RLP24 n=1 Tax=Colletotrichum truncatum TaxID=5467 RepID=A0ACC3YL03_COLTU|nr:Ribosome biogenesis protein RLP24 [Colletotrichum truncatum]KAF6797105.1 Ribosome biogenesis protein RLP24 [Colletotrichum truncatum]
MRIETCYFCSRPAYPSKGITFVRNDAKVFRFCRSKCHKNFKMKRNPRKLKWTKAYRASAHKEMTVDSTLQFGARRNVPIRYDRDLVAKTLKAMERVSEIRSRRERVFYKKRMAGKRERELATARKLVAENEHLLPRLRGSEKKRLAAEGATEDEIAAIEAQGLLSKSKAGKVFGKEKVRQRVTVDGEIIEEREGVVQEDDGEWDDDEEDGDDNDDDVEMED